VTGHGLNFGVEVDEQRFGISGFDEAVGVPVVRRLERFVPQVVRDVFGNDLALEVRH